MEGVSNEPWILEAMVLSFPFISSNVVAMVADYLVNLSLSIKNERSSSSLEIFSSSEDKSTWMISHYLECTLNTFWI